MLAERYELNQEIGRGAMGVVWRGRDTLLDRDVAIKQLGMMGGETPDLERALREAHLAASAAHHNVVAVYDLVEDAGQQWLVMELVDGPTLRDRIVASGGLHPSELTPVLRQVAGALAAAHAHDIVHRDVKPSNILLTRDGVAKLSDFGIARGLADAPLTHTGLVTGSPAYLAPEVATGRPATAASDVWSLGVTAFHALEGRQPYGTEENVLAAMYRIVNEEPPRLSTNSDVGRLVESMMQRDPHLRPTMAQIEQSLAQEEPPAATQRVPLVPDPTEPSERRWLPGAIAVTAAALVAIVAITFVLTRDGDAATETPRAGTGPTRTPAQAPASPSGSATTAALEGFVADYLTTASNDPEAAYALLTSDFQRHSGGYDGYKGFWGGVSGLDVHDVDADPANLTVAYTYSYDRHGQRRTDDVVLQLEESGDGFRIAGEA